MNLPVLLNVNTLESCVILSEIEIKATSNCTHMHITIVFFKEKLRAVPLRDDLSVLVKMKAIVA